MPNLQPKPHAKVKTTTTRIGGKRIRLTTRGGVTKASAAPVLEWELQAAAVKALRAMPEYDQAFTLAADFNAGKRDAAKAKATGLTAGEPDIRIYMGAGRLGLIELKAARTPVSADQKARHALLAALGHPVALLRGSDGESVAADAVALVRGWLAESDAHKVTHWFSEIEFQSDAHLLQK